MLRIALFLLVFSCCANAETTAFVNVNVISMSGKAVLKNQTVIVEDEAIREIGPVTSTPVPENARSIDGTDRYLMPGLAEMHAHVSQRGSRALDRMLDLFVANGVTTIRGMLGHPSHLQLRDQLLRNEVFGPRLITSGPSLNGNSVAGVKDGIAKVHRQAEAGYDFLKLHPGLSLAEFNAIAAVADEYQMPVAGHVSVAVGLELALEGGMTSIDHLDGYMEAMLPADDGGKGGLGGLFGILLADKVDTSRMAELIDKTADSGVWIVPTQVLIEGLASSESAEQLANRTEMQYMTAKTVSAWMQSKRQLQSTNWDQTVADRAIQLRRDILLKLRDAGANLLLGSDAPQVFNVPGFSTHRELQLLVDAGFTPYEAIYTATVAPGEFLSLEIGRVEPGFLADLILLDDNPLNDINNLQRIHGVMLRGRWLGPGERAALLDKHRRLR